MVHLSSYPRFFSTYHFGAHLKNWLYLAIVGYTSHKTSPYWYPKKKSQSGLKSPDVHGILGGPTPSGLINSNKGFLPLSHLCWHLAALQQVAIGYTRWNESLKKMKLMWKIQGKILKWSSDLLIKHWTHWTQGKPCKAPTKHVFRWSISVKTKLGKDRRKHRYECGSGTNTPNDVNSESSKAMVIESILAVEVTSKIHQT